MEPALESVWDLLESRASQLGITPPVAVDRDAVIAGLVDVLGVYKPQRRLKRMVRLMQSYGVLPLPGHGAVADLGLAQWLTLAGAPVAEN